MNDHNDPEREEFIRWLEDELNTQLLYALRAGSDELVQKLEQHLKDLDAIK